MNKSIISFLSICALLLSLVAPKSISMTSHTMSMGAGMDMGLGENEMLQHNSNSEHCAEMMSKQLASKPTKADKQSDCCEECDCLMGSSSNFYSPQALFNTFIHLSKGQLLASNKHHYLNPFQEFFIPPKIS